MADDGKATSSIVRLWCDYITQFVNKSTFFFINCPPPHFSCLNFCSNVLHTINVVWDIVKKGYFQAFHKNKKICFLLSYPALGTLERANNEKLIARLWRGCIYVELLTPLVKSRRASALEAALWYLLAGQFGQLAIGVAELWVNGRFAQAWQILRQFLARDYNQESGWWRLCDIRL